MSVPGSESTGGSGQRQWVHWLLTLTAVTFVGALVIPFLRSWPESIHARLGSLAAWQRSAFILGACIALAAILFRLFSPRFGHLRYLRANPPVWLAWLLGICLVGAIDLIVGLSPCQYAASIWEWFGYGGGSTGLVILYVWLSTRDAEASGAKAGRAAGDATATPTDWPSLESWLHADAPADHDFLGNHAVARRLKTMLVNGTRSIGIVGPFGAGKTTIVEWIVEMFEAEQHRTPPLLLFSQYRIDPAVFEGFFGEGTTEVIQLLSDMSGRLEGDVLKLVSAMVESAKAVRMPPLVGSPRHSPKGTE